MTTVQKSKERRPSENAVQGNTTRKPPNFVQCVNRKKDDPVFTVTGNITGMTDKRSPVSNMKMLYQARKQGPPELNFNIDLLKESGDDEKFVLTNEPSDEEKERRMRSRLCKLEKDVLRLKDQLEFVKGLRKDWNALKVGLCNRRFKDYPTYCGNELEGDE